MNRATLARLVVLATIWGSSFLLIKVALAAYSPAQIVVGRVVAGAAVLLAIVAVRRQRLPGDPVVWAHLGFVAVAATIAPYFLFGWAELRITSGLAGVLNGATPLFTLCFAVAALGEERLTPVRTAGLALGFVGVVVVVGPWNANPLTSSLPGQLACLAAAALYGVGFVYTRRYLSGRGLTPLALAASQMGLSAVIALLAGSVFAASGLRLAAVPLAAVALLGAFGTGFAYLLYFRLIADAGATSASMVTYLIPVVAVALGAVTLGEPVTWNLFVGAAVVVAGVAMAEGRLARLGPTTPTRPRQQVPM